MGWENVLNLPARAKTISEVKSQTELKTLGEQFAQPLSVITVGAKILKFVLDFRPQSPLTRSGFDTKQCI